LSSGLNFHFFNVLHDGNALLAALLFGAPNLLKTPKLRKSGAAASFAPNAQALIGLTEALSAAKTRLLRRKSRASRARRLHFPAK
jgi:hypothetical protein